MGQIPEGGVVQDIDTFETGVAALCAVYSELDVENQEYGNERLCAGVPRSGEGHD